MDRFFKYFRIISLYTICWISGISLIIIGSRHINLDCPNRVHVIFLSFIGLGLALLILPNFSKIKIGSVELERELAETKAELQNLKFELRQQVSILTSNINTIGNLSNQININLPGAKELKDEQAEIKKKTGKTEVEIEKVKRDIVLPDEDNILALAKTRIRLEYLLRKILKKRTVLSDDVKYLGLNKLEKMFFEQHPDYKYLEKSFDHVVSICNAAIHAQRITEGQINEALELGSHLIATLDDLVQTDP
jgi:hypothetical protein